MGSEQSRDAGVLVWAAVAVLAQGVLWLAPPPGVPHLVVLGFRVVLAFGAASTLVAWALRK